MKKIFAVLIVIIMAQSVMAPSLAQAQYGWRDIFFPRPTVLDWQWGMSDWMVQSAYINAVQRQRLQLAHQGIYWSSGFGGWGYPGYPGAYVGCHEMSENAQRALLVGIGTFGGTLAFRQGFGKALGLGLAAGVATKVISDLVGDDEYRNRCGNQGYGPGGESAYVSPREGLDARWSKYEFRNSREFTVVIYDGESRVGTIPPDEDRYLTASRYGYRAYAQVMTNTQAGVREVLVPVELDEKRNGTVFEVGKLPRNWKTAYASFRTPAPASQLDQPRIPEDPEFDRRQLEEIPSPEDRIIIPIPERPLPEPQRHPSEPKVNTFWASQMRTFR